MLSGREAKRPTGLQPLVDSSTPSEPAFPDTAPNNDPNAPPLDMLVNKSMLYAAGLKHGANPYLVMGLAWHESYAGPGAVTDWASLRADCRHYVWAFTTRR